MVDRLVQPFDIFHNTITEIMDELAPYHTIKVSTKKLRSDPWITMGLLKCLKKQHSLYQQFLANRNNIVIEQRYKN